MQIKHTSPGQVLFIRKRLYISDVGPASVDCSRQIQDLIDRSNLSVTGPWHFIAYHFPQDDQTEFDMDFCLPVAGECDEFLKGDIEAKYLPDLHCATCVFEGPLDDLFVKGYQPLLLEMKDEQCRLTGESREVYHNWCGPDSDKNVVEIQFGIQTDTTLS
ncbi:GyrI-like domain-containing protein [Photobacterium salinisoli]|uniref:GyrI-like domain-containing protein n=1 Tax=Photobacterium salinisoli TaxID=1616783 RepID=UPI000EA0831D|nr:GyrI-like domain-containing protein [Photobacterium salinisoli]